MSLKLTSANNRYTIVKPIMSVSRLDKLWIADSFENLLLYIKDIPADEVAVAFDIETKGTLACHSDFKLIGFGLSCSIGSIYLDIRERTNSEIAKILIPVLGLPLIGHNIYFDASGLRSIGIMWEQTNWIADTYVLYKQLANEGFIGQKWGLKEAMIDMLGWENTNEDRIDRWLVAAGYASGLSKKDDTAKKRLRKYIQKLNTKTPVRPSKSDMWRVPANRLGHYCALDCDATWQLYHQVLIPALKRVPPSAWNIHSEVFLPNIAILIDCLFSGMTVNVPPLQSYNGRLKEQIAEAKQALLSAPEVAPFVQKKEDEWIGEIRPPAQFKKDGTPSKAYQNYLEKIDCIRAGRSTKLNKTYKFNVNGDEMRELLYTLLIKYEVIKQHEGSDSIGKIRILDGPKGTNIGAELDMTDTGQLPMDEPAFMQFGELGKKLIILAGKEKLQGYVDAALGKAMECGDGKIHAQYKVHGTLTSRLAGGGNKDDLYKFNAQQMPGDPDYLACFTPRKGFVFIAADVTALEPHVLAETSRDKTYLDLFGPNAKNHDVYLFIGTKITKFKDKILAAGYNPDDPVSIAKCKVTCKHERDILKIFHLSSVYGAGVFKIWTSFRLQGIDISQYEVQQIHEDYWGPSLFGEVKQFQADLEKEWRENGGWVLDGLGCPVTVAEKFKKDLTNRVTQGCGHRLLASFLAKFLKPALLQAAIEFYWYIPDLHDETIYEVPASQADLAVKTHLKAVDDLNNYLGGVTKIKMKPKIIYSLAERKID